MNASWLFLGFALYLLDIGLLDKDLSDIDLYLLETDIDSFPVSILLSSRRLEDDLKTYLEYVLKACLEDIFRTSSV